MNTLVLLAYLLIIIIVLLCEPQERRRRTLAMILGGGAILLALHHFGLVILGAFFVVGKLAVKHLWWTLGIANMLIFAPVFGKLIWEDARDNRAIRAGSKEAFDKRVEHYMGPSFKYSREKAIETATRIRDGE